MTKRNRLAMDPNKTPETDLSGFQEQGGYIDQETIDQLEQYDKDKKTQPVDGPNKVNWRKQLYPDYKANRKFRKVSKNKNRFKGMTDDQIRAKIAEEDAQRAKEAEETRLDQDPELNKQREDIKRGDYIDDGTLDEKGNPNISIIKNLLKYGLSVRSTYSGLRQVGMPALKYLFLNGRF